VLYLVEGLNCAGKTTYIENLKKHIIYIKTHWCNPLRWSDKKKDIVYASHDYSLGAYETVLRLYKNWPEAIFWDRTFISAYIYDSISKRYFDYLVDICLENQVSTPHIIFVDTKIDTCLSRLKSLRESDPKYKDYIWCDTFVTMIDKRNFFIDVIDKLSKKGFVTQYIKGVYNERTTSHS